MTTSFALVSFGRGMDFLFVGNTCLERNAIFYIKKAYFPLFYLQLNMVNKVFAFRVPFEFSYSNRLGFYFLFLLLHAAAMHALSQSAPWVRKWLHNHYSTWQLSYSFFNCRFNLFHGCLRVYDMARLVSIIGDGNVRRNMTGLNIASRETMKKAQVIDHVIPGSFDSAFREIRPESTVCIIAALTDLILSGGDGGTIYATIDPILASFRDKVFSLCTTRPDLEV